MTSEPFRLPPAMIGHLLGLEDEGQRRLTEQVARVLCKVSPELLPSLAPPSPLQALVDRGPAALDELFALFRQATDPAERAVCLDAVARIVEAAPQAPVTVFEPLRAILAEADTEEIASLAARSLALAGDAGLLDRQVEALSSDEPAHHAAAARLLGLGRYRPALEALMRYQESEAVGAADLVVWAVGRIGDPEAVPTLVGMLSLERELPDVIAALGEIGHPSATVPVLSYVKQGTRELVLVATKALGKIARHTNGTTGTEAWDRDVRATLRAVIQSGPDAELGFCAIAAYGAFGGHMEVNAILETLGARLSDAELGSLAAFFTRPRS